MAWTIGQTKEPVGAFEADSVELVFRYARPENPAMLDIEIQGADFEEAYRNHLKKRRDVFGPVWDLQAEAEEDLSFEEAVEALSDEEREDMLEKVRGHRIEIPGESTVPVIAFINRHLAEVDGVQDADGEPVEKWAEIPSEERLTILRHLDIWDLANLYFSIKAASKLKPSVKND